MATQREMLRSFNPNRKKPRTCPNCYSTTYVTNDGRWYTHKTAPPRKRCILSGKKL